MAGFVLLISDIVILIEAMKISRRNFLPLSLQLVRIWIIGTLAKIKLIPGICSESLGNTGLACK